MNGLHLTAENVRTGRISDKQLSDFAGFPVVTAKLSELPHWDIVKANPDIDTFPLMRRYHKELHERRDAVMKLLTDAKLVGEKGHFSKQDAFEFSVVRGPVVRSTLNVVSAPTNDRSIFDAMQKRGVDEALDNLPTRHWGSLGRMPYTLTGTNTENIPVVSKYNKDGSVAVAAPYYKKSAAFIMLNGEQDGFRETCANEVRLPVSRMKRLPDRRVHSLIAAGHEGGHLTEVSFGADFNSSGLTQQEKNDGVYGAQVWFNNQIVAGYDELGADGRAHASLRAISKRTPLRGVAKPVHRQHLPVRAMLKPAKHALTRKERPLTPREKASIREGLEWDRHKRYMDLRSDSPNYWFAPILDALDQRRKPPDYYQVHQSVMEIRMRVMAEADRLQRLREGQPSAAPITSDELNRTVAGWRRYPGSEPYVPEKPKTIGGIELRSDRMTNLMLCSGELRKGIDNLYLDWNEHQLSKKPEIFYTLVRQSLDDGAFDANPLTRRIAARIVRAADYFDPELTRAADTVKSAELIKRPPGFAVTSPAASFAPLQPAQQPVHPVAFMPQGRSERPAAQL